MNRTGVRRLLWLIIGIAVLAVVGVVAYSFGLAANHAAAHTAFGPLRGNYAYALGFGAGPFGLLAAVLFGFVLVWLFVALISGPAAGPHQVSPDPAGVDRLGSLAFRRRSSSFQSTASS